jgi:hypothetical protein
VRLRTEIGRPHWCAASLSETSSPGGSRGSTPAASSVSAAAPTRTRSIPVTDPPPSAAAPRSSPPRRQSPPDTHRGRFTPAPPFLPHMNTIPVFSLPLPHACAHASARLFNREMETTHKPDMHTSPNDHCSTHPSAAFTLISSRSKGMAIGYRAVFLLASLAKPVQASQVGSPTMQACPLLVW